MYQEKYMSDDLELDYEEDEPETGIILGDVINSILDNINSNVHLMILPIVVFSVFYLHNQFIFMDFKKGISYASKNMEMVKTKEDTIIWLKDISNNTSLRYTYDGNIVHLYKGDFFIDFKN